MVINVYVQAFALFDNTILTYMHIYFVKKSVGRFVSKRSRDRPSRPAHSAVEKIYLFPPIRKKQFFSYL